MNHLFIAEELRRNCTVFEGLLRGLTEEQYLWKPTPEKWCLLEIICHLYDEEREDFRTRMLSVLEDPHKALLPIDPQGWVNSRNYMERDYEHVLSNFLAERLASVALLHSLTLPKWNNTYQHPKLGAMPASLFLNNWLAHDYLHFRQITATRYLFHKAHSADPLAYAGEW